MDFSRAKFLQSYGSVHQIKNSGKAEFAFIGRSNVGKSSLINALVNKKDLAKTSAKPGKTQLINFFSIEDQIVLVDLPGYGYAKVSKKLREQFEGLITEYLLHSENLFIVFVLVDAAIPPQRIDLEFLEWCGVHRVPVGVVFTKTDKRKPKETEKNMRDFESELAKYFEELPVTFETSSTTKYGMESLQNWIGEAKIRY
jgi:GTP-binding protein